MKFYNHVKKIMDATARKKENCPLDKKCLMPKIIYEPHITNNINNEHRKYVGVVETSFKVSYSNHIQGLKHNYMKCTKLSKYIWHLRNQGLTPIVKWRIVKKVSSKVSLNSSKICFPEKKFYC